MPSPSAPVSPGVSNRLLFGCMLLFGFAFFAAGLLSFVVSVRQYAAQPNAVVGVIVGGVFMLAGAAAMLAIVYASKAWQKKDALKAQHPEQPWMWREDWAQRSIKDASKGAVIGLWFFTVLWNAISFPIAFLVTKELKRDNLMPLIVYLFPLAGVIVLITAIYYTLRNSRFGTSICHLDKVPIVPGRMFRGDIEVNTEAIAADGYRLRLALINAITSRTGKNRSTTEHLIWDTEIVVESSAALRGMTGTRVPFQFATPPGSHPTDDTDTYNKHLWRLTASAALPGVDYGASFDLPVYQTGEQVDGSEYEAFQQRHRGEAARHQIKPASGVEITRLPSGGEQFRIHAPKTIGGVIGSFLFLLIWNAAIAAMIKFEAPWGFPLVFGIIDLLLLAASIDYYLGQSTIDVDRNGVRVIKRWRGLGSKTSAHEAASIKSIDGTTAGASSLSHAVTLTLNDGTTHTLGSALPDRASADIVAAKMMTDLGRA